MRRTRGSCASPTWARSRSGTSLVRSSIASSGWSAKSALAPSGRVRPAPSASAGDEVAAVRELRDLVGVELVEREAEDVCERLCCGGADVVDRQLAAELAGHRRELVPVEPACRDPVGE